jgi:hypothetical protein
MTTVFYLSLLAHGRWFFPASSTTKTGRHDITEILLKVALNTNKNHQQICLISVTLNVVYASK